MGKTTGFTKAPPKNFKKQQRGGDQEFTLQKGVSAAPIKQSRVTGTKKSIIEGAVIGGAAVGGWELGKKTSKKVTAKPITKRGWGKAYKRGG